MEKIGSASFAEFMRGGHPGGNGGVGSRCEEAFASENGGPQPRHHEQVMRPFAQHDPWFASLLGSTKG